MKHRLSLLRTLLEVVMVTAGLVLVCGWLALALQLGGCLPAAAQQTDPTCPPPPACPPPGQMLVAVPADPADPAAQALEALQRATEAMKASGQ